MIDKDYIYKNMPKNTQVDDFYVLELKLSDNKLKELGCNIDKVYSYINRLFGSKNYVIGTNNFIYTLPEKGNMFSFYDELDVLMEKEWFKESLISADRYRKVNFNVDYWYCNDYAIGYYRNKEKYGKLAMAR